MDGSVRNQHEILNGSTARRRANPANNNQPYPAPPNPPPPTSRPPPTASRPPARQMLEANGRQNSQDERRRSMVDPDMQFEKFLFKDQTNPSSLLDSPPRRSVLDSPPKQVPVIKPPTLRPQHVYAPMPTLGALSFLGKKKGDELDEDDFSKLPLGKTNI